MSDFFDDDIAQLELTEIEKNGLQIYRNYTKAFETHREKHFSEEVNKETFDTEALKKVVNLVATEEARLLPIIVCAYADELLDDMFKRHVPDAVPGGRRALFGPYGPFSNLATRIQLAFCFDMISDDLLRDLDKLRLARNNIAHEWDVSCIGEYFKSEPISTMSTVEKFFDARKDLPEGFAERLDELDTLRVRLFWNLARLTYETNYYPRAKARRLNPRRTLFGENHPKVLSAISGVALLATYKVATRSSGEKGDAGVTGS